MQLIVNTRGTVLKRRKERFVLRREDRSHEFAAAKVSSIVITTGVAMTSDVIQLANEHNVDIVFLDKSGMPTARVWQSKLGRTAAIRRRQLEVAESEEGLQIAAEWVSSKLENQIRFLAELSKRRPNDKDSIESVSGSLNEPR